MNKQIKQLNKNIQEYLSQEEYQNILKTYAELYNKTNNSQIIEQNLSWANQASKMKLDQDTIIACLLFDLNKKNIETKFNKNVLNILKELDQVNKIEQKILTPTKRERSAENKRNLLISISQDYRVLVIKIIDALKTMETIHLEKNKRIKQIKSIYAIKVYAPLAYRLGFEGICSQIEKLAFPHAFPKQYRLTKKFLGNKYEKLEKELLQAKNELEVYLKQNKINYTSLEFRRKQFYSIWKKYNKHNNYSQIYDIIAIRVIVNTTEECYLTLDTIHSLWKPIEERFKDYIKVPKQNNYQALHTTIKRQDQPIEIQIKTQEMYERSHIGITSHWVYSLTKLNTWNKIPKKLKSLENINFKTTNKNEIFNIYKNDVLKDNIFVISPKGDVYSLPKNSTPIDFAFKVHTDIGNNFFQAYVNNKKVKNTYILKSGDIVNIKTNKYFILKKYFK